MDARKETLHTLAMPLVKKKRPSCWSMFPSSGVRLGRDRQPRAFTLLELLVVIAIMGLLAALMVPAFNSMLKSRGVENACYDIKSAIETARSYAMANNTYTWVGFYEENANATTPTASQPPYSGVGRVVVAVVASKNGTSNRTSGADPARTLETTGPASEVTQIGRVMRLANVHLADIGQPSGGDPTTLAGRPDSPYQDAFSRISSETGEKAKFPFTAQNYTFWKTIRFNPKGEAMLGVDRGAGNASTDDLVPALEIGLRPTNGNVPDNGPNVGAVQISGITGNVTIYRP